MLTLELTIQRKTDDGWPLIAEQIRPGFLPIRSEGLLALDQRTLLRAVTPRAYGTLLGEALFQGPMRDAFVRALAESNEDIRVLLFVETAELRVLRWERLCAPFAGANGNGWDFLLLNQRTLFSLYLPSLTDRRYPPIGRRDLRALVLIACPSGLDQYGLVDFNAAATAGQVRQALGGIPFDLLTSPGPYANGDMDVAGNGMPETVGPASLDALCQRLTEQPYTLVHVVCHGHYDHKSGETSLFLANSDHELARVTATQLLERLARLRGRRGLPHFAFLATCDSAAPEAEGALGGLAQRLVRELGMPAVIAMTEKVSITTAQLLTGSFYAHLQKHGEVDRALVEATNAIAERSDVTVPAIYSRLGGQPLFSQSLDRELTAAEVADGLDTLGKLVAERAPVLEAEFQFAADGWRRYLARDQLSLTDAQVMERRAAQVTVEQIADSAIELSFKELCLGNAPPAYDARCPFRGLVAFGVADQPFFFGREGLVEQVRERLAHQPFLAILGPSGSGKSSLVLAGLMPALQKQYATIAVHVMTPGTEPVAALAVAVAQLGMDQGEVAQPTLLVVDQFEESFTLCTDESLRRRFFQQLLALVAPGGGSDSAKGEQPQPRVILTMRADFWGECASYPLLRDQMLAHQLLIGPMSSSELRAAMEQQARTVGLRFEADLANTILDDVAGEPGAMPLLQHGLRELWQRRYGRWLPAVAYREMGGIKRAIAGSAEAIYNSVSMQQQDWIRSIFVRLTRVDHEALPGQERRDTRRRIPLNNLIPVAADRAAFIALIAKLADARLVVSDYNAVSGEDEVEVAHEALIREWHRLRLWLDEDWEGLRLQRQINEATVLWMENNRATSYLFTGQRLQRARQWQIENADQLNQQELHFIQSSHIAQRNRRLQRTGIWSAFVLLPIMAAVVVSYLASVLWFAPQQIEWSAIDTLPWAQSRIHDMAWSAEGALYVGVTADDGRGLAMSRDDGASWKSLDIEANFVLEIASASDALYVVTNSGDLLRIHNNSWQKLAVPLWVQRAALGGDGELFVSGGADIFDLSQIYYRDDQQVWLPIYETEELSLGAIAWQETGLLAGRDRGLWQYNDAEWVPVVRELPGGSQSISLIEAVSDVIFVQTLGELYELTPDNSLTLITHQMFRRISALAGPVFLGITDDTLYCWRKPGDELIQVASITRFQPATRFTFVRVNAQKPDEIWLGTDGGLYSGSATEWLADGGCRAS